MIIFKVDLHSNRITYNDQVGNKGNRKLHSGYEGRQ